MRKIAIAAILSLATAGAYAGGYGNLTHNFDAAGAFASGAAGNVSKSVSMSRGNGTSINGGGSYSEITVHGYANDSYQGRRGRYNGYEAGVGVEADAASYGYSYNDGQARGFSFNAAAAGGEGAVFGEADSHTHDWAYRGRCRTYFGPRVSEAEAGSIGFVKAGTANMTITTGKGIGGTDSGASAETDIWGIAETNRHGFYANAGGDAETDTYSISGRRGAALTGGISGAKALDLHSAEGWAAHDLWND